MKTIGLEYFTDKEIIMMKTVFAILIILYSVNVYGQKDTVIRENLIVIERNGDYVAYKKGDTIPFSGFLAEYYDSKKIKSLAEYINGHTRNSRVMGFFENGNKESEYTYGEIDGMEDGNYLEYFENGSIKIKGKYEKGSKNGKWEHFDEKGKLIKTEIFKDDELLKTIE